MHSIDPLNNINQIFETYQKTREGASTNTGGNSGSFFFFTEDKKYIVKTISLKEVKVFESVINDLQEHYTNQESQGSPSLITMVHGIYQFKLDKQPSIYLMLMKNSFQKQIKKSKIIHKFDLKGSMVKRRTLPKKLLKYHQLYRFCKSNILKD